MDPRVLIITGANGGLGQAIARAFLAEAPGNDLWLGIHQRWEQVDVLCREHPGRCHRLELDVTQGAGWQSAVERVLEVRGRIDVLVNNAGHPRDALLAQMSESTWREVLATNLDGVFFGCRAVLPTMIAQRHGRIINVASLSALLPPPGQTNYAAAKAGVVALTQSLAKEIARIGITVNAVCPGYVETGQLATLSADERRAAVARIPLRRFGRPDEVAAAVRFLACREAGYITGSVLKIDGGIL